MDRYDELLMVVDRLLLVTAAMLKRLDEIDDRIDYLIGQDALDRGEETITLDELEEKIETVEYVDVMCETFVTGSSNTGPIQSSMDRYVDFQISQFLMNEKENASYYLDTLSFDLGEMCEFGNKLRERGYIIWPGQKGQILRHPTNVKEEKIDGN